MVSQSEREAIVPSVSATNRQYYELPEAVSHFSSLYAVAKEEAFCRFLTGLVPQASAMRLLELGGGPGLHGCMFDRLWGAYTHSDYSTAMCARAQASGLHSLRIDAIHLPDLWDYDAVLSIGISTVISGDLQLLAVQIAEFGRAMKAGQILIIETGSKLPFGIPNGTLHCLDAADIRALETTGFSLLTARRWGLLPGALWRRLPGALCRAIERIASAFNLGFRYVAVFRREEKNG